MKTYATQLKYAAVITGAFALAAPANADTLRLLTWGGYAPENVIEKFEAETGHTVEVTLSNNEEMIAKLRATGGGGFDLAQPSQDRIAGPQAEFGIYKPMSGGLPGWFWTPPRPTWSRTTPISAHPRCRAMSPIACAARR